MNRKYWLSASALLLAGMLGGAAFAQEIQTTAPQPPDEDTTEVDEIVVQANRRDESIQDVPVAVTAFTAEQRDELGVITVFDMTRATPSFEYTTAIDRAFIRGIGRNTNAPGTQAGVALYIDGVYTPKTFGLDRAPILSGNTEIDSGPQGTLFGRNAIGGVIQQATVHAKDEFEIVTSTRYNDHERLDFAATIGGPLGENFKLLVGGNYRHQTGGYFWNQYLKKPVGGPTDEWLALGVLDYKFGDAFDGFLKVEALGYERYLSQYSQYGSRFTNRNPNFNDFTYTNQISVTQNFNCATPDPALFANPLTRKALVNCPTNVAQAVVYYDPRDLQAQNDKLLYNDWRTRHKSDGNGNIANQTTWHLPWFDLKYIGGYSQWVYHNIQDYDNTARGVWEVDPDGPANIMPRVQIFPSFFHYYEDEKYYSHELNFNSIGDGPLTWIYGLYYYHDDFLNNTWIDAPGQTQLNTVPGVDNSRLDYFSTSGHAITETYATFGQVDWAVNDKWTLTAGLRWNLDDVQTTEEDHYYSWVPGVTAPYNAATGQYGNAQDFSRIFVPGTCAPANQPTIVSTGATCSYDPLTNTRKIGNDWDGWGGVLNASYAPNDDTLIYLKYSRGYKAGGIAISGAMSVRPVMEPEHLNAYEVGYKFRPGRTLTVNTALFYYDYRDYQDFGNIPNTFNSSNNALVSVGFNVPRAETIGVEVTGSWHPTSQFTLTFSGNYMDAKVKDGGAVTLPNTLDPEADGTTRIRHQDGRVEIVNYTPKPCGPVIVSAGVPYQPQCITGTALKGSAPWKVWISPQYRFDFDVGSLDVIANFSARAGNVSTYSFDPIYEAPDYHSADLRVIWTPDKGDYKIIAFMNNVTNNEGYEFVLAGRTNAPPPPPGTSPADALKLSENFIQNVLTIPRTWGIEFQKRF